MSVAGAIRASVNAQLLRTPLVDPPSVEHPVSVLVPARNEAERIGECVRRLRAQQRVPSLEIVVYDDLSEDDTAARAREAAGDDPRLRVVDGAPLPPGWLGKPHACAALASAAAPGSEVLLFVDADVELEPLAVVSTVDLLHRSGLDFLSPLPRLQTIGLAERLVQPLLPWSLLTFVPLRLAERSEHPSLAVASGPLLAVRRTTYERSGGHGAVRDQVVEDIALARAFRASGATGGVADGTTIATLRMYAGWAQLRDGYGKSAWCAFGGPGQAVAAMAGLGATYVLPAIAALVGSRVGMVGYAAATLSRVIAARRTANPVWPDSAAHPLSVLAAAAITARSIRDHRRGRLTWKDRPL